MQPVFVSVGQILYVSAEAAAAVTCKVRTFKGSGSELFLFLCSNHISRHPVDSSETAASLVVYNIILPEGCEWTQLYFYTPSWFMTFTHIQLCNVTMDSQERGWVVLVLFMLFHYVKLISKQIWVYFCIQRQAQCFSHNIVVHPNFTSPLVTSLTQHFLSVFLCNPCSHTTTSDVVAENIYSMIQLQIISV